MVNNIAMLGYKFSKDYKLMYEYIIHGINIFCIVDYDFYRDNNRPIVRDACLCKKRMDGSISFGVRGVEYGSVASYMVSDMYSEEDLFIEECKSLNLEFISPDVTHTVETLFTVNTCPKCMTKTMNNE